MASPPPDKPPLEAFLEQYWKDKEEDTVRDLLTYLTMFPGDQNAVAQAFLANEDEGPDPYGFLERMRDPYFYGGWVVSGTGHARRRVKHGSRSDRIEALAELRERIRGLIRPATKLVLTPRTNAAAEVMESRFGGSPYAEAGESWPMCAACGEPMDFVCQVDLRDSGVAVPDVGLFTFFYCWETGPWGFLDDDDGAWEVRLYSRPSATRAVPLDRPKTHGSEGFVTKPCNVAFEPASTLPDHNDIEQWFPDVETLCKRLNHESPWLPYRKVGERLVGDDFPFRSRVGGWPTWVQFSPLPQAEDGKPMFLLAQLDSEEAAGLTWGDVGCVYLMLDPANPKDVQFQLDCT